MKRVGVIGAGPMGRLHARTVTRLAVDGGMFQLVRVLDRHRGRASLLANDFNAQPSLDLDTFSREVDVAIVAVPTAGHLGVAKALVDRGLDVLVEKPLALDVAEGQALVEAARTAGRILQVGHVEWFNPAWRVAADDAGELVRIEVERWQPPSERGRDIGVIEDLMLHDLDWITRYIGEPVREVAAVCRVRTGGVFDEVEALLRFDGGCVAHLHASRVAEERRRIARFFGHRGQVTADLDGSCVIAPDGETRAVGFGSAFSDAVTDLQPEPRDALEAQWLAFVSACRSRTQPANHAQVGVDALLLVQRVHEAVARSRKGASLDDNSRLRR